MAYPSSLRLLVFDLDGTLIDSKDDLVASVNATLRHLDRPELPSEVIASYVGNGAPMLLRRALGVPEECVSLVEQGGGVSVDSLEARDLKAALDYFLGYYREHKLDHTRLYPGVKETLRQLAVRYELCVLTNKPVRASRDILAGLGVAELFSRVYGGNSFATKKPNPEGLNQLMAEHQVTAVATLMIGDSGVDVRTARNAGAWSCGVTYGFGAHDFALDAPDYVVHSAAELAERLLQPALR